ncbi:hypothetical protein P152DRAFT_461441 [Eremomyces bilateralis CBS 781.70]|uniref:Uncharacterized protein n=1 Tax=Eremomyces bilateralis CBS 781.70 TaxID=1392243 RepID=A0A6G1FUQ9_9PEZI|nr:uncharacterized protein P152DRAFT_461441 [Eremomyces bilateralis CBS 781.70]KAF1809493.1 hypothetical protein P152DRAFT_461441 [Eremomyces bilateralis CBS 781.70]
MYAGFGRRPILRFSPASWSHPSFADGDPDWVLKWWKANAPDFPCMAQAVRD